MRKTAIRPKRLHRLAKEFLRTYPLTEKNPKGGRPKAYPEDIILAISSIQKLGHFSFRETLEYCENFFIDLPSLSVYHERLRKFPQRLRREFMTHLGM